MSKTEKVSGARANAFQSLTTHDVALNGRKKKSLARGFSTWVRVLLQNWRQGTVGCLGRADVNRSGKKPFKQKGTGRARAGSARSPLWRGGGVVFGPQPRVRTLRVPQKLKSAVLRNALIDQLDRNNVIVADWSVKSERPKTSDAYEFLKTAGLNDAKITLFLSWADKVTAASFSNIPSVNVVFFDQLNAFDMMSGRKLVVLKKDMQQFRDMVAKWS
jgi:large subunit ribosomal protein L4